MTDKRECVHHTGMLNPRTPVCKAGVNYRELGDAKARPIGWVRRMPCIEMHDSAEVAQCPHYRAKTAEEKAAEEAGVKLAVARVLKVMPVVNVWRKKPPMGKSEVIECPLCGGKLHLSQAECNGHVWAKCATADCVSWME